jgi:integrase
MATIKIVKDKRTDLKDKKFNLSIRVCHKGVVQYLPIVKMTDSQYEQVFVRQSMDQKSIEFRESVNAYKTKCERIFAEMGSYNPKRFRELVNSQEKEVPKTLIIKDLFDYYIENYEGIALKTRMHFKFSINKLESFQPGLTVNDITPDFLRRFDNEKKKLGLSRSTIDGVFRNLRRIINYFQWEKKVIPKSYEYPFGKGGYTIYDSWPKKLVLRNNEIQKVVDFNKFDNKEQEYARDIWLFLYRANGINFADLLRMKWDHIQGGYLIFFRKKTENTRKSNIRPITVPITPSMQELIDKIGSKDSPFILGLLKEGYAANTFENLKHKVRAKINENLNVIGEKLSLSVPLKLKTARDCYAQTLKRSGISKDDIGEMLGHANSIVTERYLASMDFEKTDEINQHIF